MQFAGSMTTKTRRILETLARDELQDLVAQNGLKVRDRRVREDLIEAVAGSREVDLAAHLGGFSRDRLKEICRSLGLDDSGKEKAGIVARILGTAPASAAKPAGQTALDLEPATPAPAPAKAKRAAKAAPPSKPDGNGGDLGFERKLFQAADKLRNNMDAAEYKHVVLGLIFLKYISDAFEELHARLVEQAAEGADPEDRDEYRAERVFWVPKAARWSGIQAKAKQASIGQTIDDAMVAIEKDNPSLRGVLPKNYGRPGLDKQRLGELVDLIGTIGLGTKEHQSKDILGRVYEYFLSEFALAEGRKGGQFYTPRSVVRLLVEMLAPYKGRVYDPCCGSGGMFVQSEKFVEEHGGRHGDVSVYGQESNETTWRLAKMNLAIRGIEANLGPEHADTFHRDLHRDLKADYILANPPFNAKDWGVERLAEDVRWKYGTPPAGNANFGWVQHFIHHLAPTGQAGFVLANGSMSSNQSGEGEIRKAIVEADLIDCMVALPGQLFYSTQIAACLWFLARDKKNHRFRDRRGRVLLIDARKFGRMIDRTQRELTDEEIARIAETYHAWRGDKGAGKYEDIAGFCKSATLDEIRLHQHVLTPGRYVGAEEVEDEDEPFEQRFTRLTARLDIQFAEALRLQEVIRQRLGVLRYE
ncbi:type I restriction enzyme M protein [Nannocystis exedens]|uniref:site-specific DNA-methyltransferase (adenine-specific) n=2 Tax=Nannocystis exedens TaxID=54 RepID=A0A1I2J4M8_9BACT|nr:Type I restriction enzyme EcoKI M protein [Nannocystis exedens]SFF47876.1 type I restriction enzyme M protein [Nannocystis exedens]